LEHNFGHGKETLASILVALNLLAFAMHNACDLIESLWQRARERLGARARLFEHIRSITAYYVFPSWHSLLRTIVTGVPPPLPG
jgi:divalent metal cation (Fe/Co/Zn/Cd) transporter